MKKGSANNKILKSQLNIGIIGAGRVGSNIAFWLSKAGWHIKSIYSQSEEHSFTIARKIPTGISKNLEDICLSCDVLIIAVPDSSIVAIAEEIADIHTNKVRTLIHCSGLLSSKILDPSGTQFSRASMHPLISIPPLSTEKNPFLNTYFGIEGDRWALDIVENFVHDLGGKYFYLDPEQKVLYHTVATLITGGIYVLGEIANKAWSKTSHNVQPILLFEKLVQSVIENHKKSTIDKIITGPIARQDTEAVITQMVAIKGTEYEEIYSLIGKEVARLARVSEWWQDVVRSLKE